MGFGNSLIFQVIQFAEYLLVIGTAGRLGTINLIFVISRIFRQTSVVHNISCTLFCNLISTGTVAFIFAGLTVDTLTEVMQLRAQILQRINNVFLIVIQRLLCIMFGIHCFQESTDNVTLKCRQITALAFNAVILVIFIQQIIIYILQHRTIFQITVQELP